MEVSLPIRVHLSGRLARVFKYERRINQRCPSTEFLGSIQKPMRNRFSGQMDALTKDGGGTEYENYQRFHALHGDGKPLWEFKEHDHRLYCVRLPRKAGRMDIVLLNGWIKEKTGRTEKEDREIEKAISLYNEFLAEYPGGNI
jgi:hypothetical protein